MKRNLVTNSSQTNGAEKAVNILDNLNDLEKKYLKQCLEGFTDEDAVEQDAKTNVWEKKKAVYAPLKSNITTGLNFSKKFEK